MSGKRAWDTEGDLQPTKRTPGGENQATVCIGDCSGNREPESGGSRGKLAPGTRRVKFGVIGAGSAWGFHSAACAGSPYLEFVAVYDKNQKLAEKVAKRYKANPMEAFSETLYRPEEYGFDQLPGRSGVYSRPRCSRIMDKACEEYEPVVIEGQDEPGKLARFCRECEFACPVGAP